MARARAPDPAAAPDDELWLGLTPRQREPDDLCLVVMRDEVTGARCAGRMRWGIKGEDGALRRYLRAETLFDTPRWDQAVRHRRLILPAFEYVQRATRGSDPGALFAVTLEEDAPMAVGAVWEDAADGPRFAILTRAAEAAIAPIHDRMPVLLAEAHWPLWLSDVPFLRDGLRLMITGEGFEDDPALALHVRRVRRIKELAFGEQLRLLGLGEPEQEPATRPRRRAAAVAITRSRRRALG
ncbi:MAG TPA: SOS response-associated peptidase family protein [Acetobacteraceae bacterium]|nr:SOS response-associated peptidase family protein [Acetobacteraceae bacterium]